MTVGVCITGAIGALLLVLGFLIGKGEKISLLHAYHYERVKGEDKKSFCALCGGGIACIGAGLAVSAVLLALFEKLWCFLPFAGAFLVGLCLLIYAERKYNREEK